MNELPSTCTPRGASEALEVKKWLNHGKRSTQGAIAQLGERWLCKPEVAGSSPAGSTEVTSCDCCSYRDPSSRIAERGLHDPSPPPVPKRRIMGHEMRCR